MQITIKGNQRLAARLKRLTTRLEHRTQTALEQGAHRIAARAEQNAPRKTGRLGNSIGVRGEGDAVIVDATAPYAAAVEFGTVHQLEQPFLGPALEEERAALIRHMARAVKEAVK